MLFVYVFKAFCSRITEILLEHLLTTADKRSAFSGMALSLAMLILFGADGFMLPAMASILIVLTFAAKKEVAV